MSGRTVRVPALVLTRLSAGHGGEAEDEGDLPEAFERPNYSGGPDGGLPLIPLWEDDLAASASTSGTGTAGCRSVGRRDLLLAYYNGCGCLLAAGQCNSGRRLPLCSACRNVELWGTKYLSREMIRLLPAGDFCFALAVRGANRAMVRVDGIPVCDEESQRFRDATDCGGGDNGGDDDWFVGNADLTVGSVLSIECSRDTDGAGTEGAVPAIGRLAFVLQNIDVDLDVNTEEPVAGRRRLVAIIPEREGLGRQEIVVKLGAHLPHEEEADAEVEASERRSSSRLRQQATAAINAIEEDTENGGNSLLNSPALARTGLGLPKDDRLYGGDDDEDAITDDVETLRGMVGKKAEVHWANNDGSNEPTGWYNATILFHDPSTNLCSVDFEGGDAPIDMILSSNTVRPRQSAAAPNRPSNAKARDGSERISVSTIQKDIIIQGFDRNLLQNFGKSVIPPALLSNIDPASPKYATKLASLLTKKQRTRPKTSLLSSPKGSANTAMAVQGVTMDQIVRKASLLKKSRHSEKFISLCRVVDIMKMLQYQSKPMFYAMALGHDSRQFAEGPATWRNRLNDEQWWPTFVLLLDHCKVTFDDLKKMIAFLPYERQNLEQLLRLCWYVLLLTEKVTHPLAAPQASCLFAKIGKASVAGVLAVDEQKHWTDRRLDEIDSSKATDALTVDTFGALVPNEGEGYVGGDPTKQFLDNEDNVVYEERTMAPFVMKGKNWRGERVIVLDTNGRRTYWVIANKRGVLKAYFIDADGNKTDEEFDYRGALKKSVVQDFGYSGKLSQQSQHITLFFCGLLGTGSVRLFGQGHPWWITFCPCDGCIDGDIGIDWDDVEETWKGRQLEKS